MLFEGSTLFVSDDCTDIQAFFSGSNQIEVDTILSSITAFQVSKQHPVYTSVEGVLFSGDKTCLVSFPDQKAGCYTIPDSVTTIADSAFDYCENLEKVLFGSSVLTIGKLAFYHCTGLSGIQLSSTLQVIKDAAFAYCTRLVSIALPHTVSEIGSSVFYECSSLECIEVRNPEQSARYISLDGMLCDKTAHSLIRVPQNKKGEIRVPEVIHRIESNALFNCRSITKVHIHKSVLYIPGDAFSMCTGLKQILVDPDNSAYCDVDGILYDKHITRLVVFPAERDRLFTVPDSLREFGDYCFYSIINYKKTLTIKNPNAISILHGFSVFNPQTNSDS